MTSWLEWASKGLGVVAPGHGRKPNVPAEVMEAIVAEMLTVMPPDGAACWSTRQIAARYGLDKDFVPQTLAPLGAAPVAADVFKVSADPDFEAKLHDMAGL